MEFSKSLLCGLIVTTLAAQGCGDTTCPVVQDDGGTPSEDSAVGVESCGAFSNPPANSYVTYSGVQAMFHCFPGFERTGEATGTCSNSGTWPAVDTQCVPIVHFDESTQLEWDARPADAERTYPEAEAYCDSLSLEGRTDWRIPTAREMLSLHSFAGTTPVWDTNVYRTRSSVSGIDTFWLSNEVGHEDNHFYFGASATFQIAAPLTSRVVRCVRGTWEGAALTDNADGTVTDSVTGLTWQQASDDAMRSHANAVSYCSSLALDGGGWRMPTAPELRSIYEPIGYKTFDDDVFDDADNTYVWSTTQEPTWGGYWTFATNGSSIFLVTTGSDSAGARVRCVR